MSSRRSEAYQVSLKSHPTLIYHRVDLDSDSDEDRSKTGIVDRLEKRRHRERVATHEPMSAAVRQDSRKLTKPTSGSKYTLRSNSYIPFKKARDEKRLLRQLQQRGGSDEMDRFVQLQQEREWLDAMRKEAERHSFDPSLCEEYEEQIKEALPDPPLDYEKELEQLVKQAEEYELDELIANLDLNK